MTARATVKAGEIRRVLREAKAAGFVVEYQGFRLWPPELAPPLTASPNAPSPSDPLDAELAQWAAKHGYD